MMDYLTKGNMTVMSESFILETTRKRQEESKIATMFEAIGMKIQII